MPKKSTASHFGTPNGDRNQTPIQCPTTAWEQLDAILAASRIDVLSLDENLRVDRVTERLGGWIGIDAHARGRPLRDRGNILAAQVIDAARQVAREGNEVTYSLRRPGSRAQLLLRATPYRLGPLAKGVLITLVDVDRFVPACGSHHDLRTPLASISGYAALAIADVETEPTRSYLDAIRRNANKIADVLNGDEDGNRHQPTTPQSGRRQHGSNTNPVTHILIVEDDPDSAEALRLLLEAVPDRSVRVALTGAEALAHASAFEPQVCLIDLGLPDMSGIELRRQLGDLTSCRASRYIALTGTEEVDRRWFDGVMIKPVDVNTLEDLIRSVSAPDGPEDSS